MALLHLSDHLSLANASVLASIFFLYCATVVIYRLFFHPLSKIPSYKVAATTRLYEFFYDSTSHGLLWKKLQEMHRDLGPIVRINPYEVHINDPKFYHQLYNFDMNWSRDPLFVRELDLSKNIEVTVDSHLHRKRRAPFNNFFSRMKITQLEDMIHCYANQICDTAGEMKAKDGIVNLSLLYRCFTAEIICQYCFGKNYGFFEDLTRANRLLVNVTRPGDLPGVYHLGRFTSLVKVVIFFSNAIYIIMSKLGLPVNPGPNEFFGYATDLIQGALKTAADANDPPANSKKESPKSSHAHSTVFHQIIKSDLAPEEKSFPVLFENALLFLFAGFETTGFALTLATYQVLVNPEIHTRLKEELRTIWPNATDPAPSWAALEKSPLLHATLLESLRLSHGVMSRLSRVNYKHPVTYGGYTIPAGYPISMSQPLIHKNPDIFPEPERFNPDRWLQGSPDDIKNLEKYLVPFSSGSRGCIGIHLAMAELHIALATVLRRFENMEVMDARAEDILPYFDEFIPMPKNGKQRLLVKIG